MFALVGGSNTTATWAQPQRGHFRRLASSARGNALARVQTRVGRSSSVLNSQARPCFSPPLAVVEAAHVQAPAQAEGFSEGLDRHQNKMRT